MFLAFVYIQPKVFTKFLNKFKIYCGGYAHHTPFTCINYES